MIDLAWWDFAALEGLRADDRLRVLSRAAAAVLFRLVLVGRGGAEVPYLNHHTGIGSVAVYDLRESDTDPAARAALETAVRELVDTGLVAFDDAARVIVLDLHAGVLAREVPAAGGDVAGTGGPRRPPSHAPGAQRERKLRWEFARRVARFAPAKVAIPADATWEAWSASDAGRAYLATLDAARNNPAPCSEQLRNKARNNPEQGGTTPEQPPSLTLPSPETKGKEETEGAHEPSAEQGGTTRRNNPPNKPEQGAEQPRRRRAPKVPAEDAIPLPGTPEREVYDAIVGDPALQPITGNPGDFAVRACSGAYPHLDARAVAAVVRRCGEYAAREPGRYTDGRRALSNWLREEDARAAARPRPAAPAPRAAVPPATPPRARDVPQGDVPPRAALGAAIAAARPNLGGAS